MSAGHRLIITEGVVLAKRGAGEANTLAVILTEDIGLVQAKAQSARRERSKLRYGLEPLAQGRFSFVRGKHEWKLIGAEQASRAILDAPSQNRSAAGRITRLIMRLVQGEEAATPLFRIMRDGFSLLAIARAKEDIESVECVLVLRILFNLGYLPNTPELAPFINDASLSLELASRAAASRSALVRAINESLSASGL